MVLGIPRWAHRRLRARVRIERTIQAWPSIADAAGLPGSRITSAAGDAGDGPPASFSAWTSAFGWPNREPSPAASKTPATEVRTIPKRMRQP